MSLVASYTSPATIFRRPWDPRRGRCVTPAFFSAALIAYKNEARRYHSSRATGRDWLGMPPRSLAELRPGLPVLYMSGHPVDGTAHCGLHRGRHDFIAKPFAPATLAESVRALIESRSPGSAG